MGERKPYISVDDTELLLGSSSASGSRPGSARDKQGLTSEDESSLPVPVGGATNKHPNFPRIETTVQPDPHSQLLPESANLGGHHSSSLHSLECPDNYDQFDRFSTGGQLGLLRSQSANTVDSLHPQDGAVYTPYGSSGGSGSGAGVTSNFLSPYGTDLSGTNITTRSTSCPGLSQIADTRHQIPVVQQSPTKLDKPAGSPPGGDINLEGEVITDLPVEPLQNFPELFIGDHSVLKCKKKSNDAAAVLIDAFPISTSRKSLHSSIRLAQSDTKSRSGTGDSRLYRNRDGGVPYGAVVNIGDLPSEIANQIMCGKLETKTDPNDADHVRQRCQQWLDSLSL